MRKHPAKCRRVEGQDTGVDTEQRVPAQHFHTVIFEVERAVGDYGRGVNRRLVVRTICDCEVG